MLCYFCQTGESVGGTRFNVHFAIGICQQCGAGVCLEHSHKSPEPGSPLLCKSCAEKAHHMEGKTAEPATLHT